MTDFPTADAGGQAAVPADGAAHLNGAFDLDTEMSEQRSLRSAREDDALRRARAAERRLESLVRLATEIVPLAEYSAQDGFRTAGAWRAFVRELHRARRHLDRSLEEQSHRH